MSVPQHGRAAGFTLLETLAALAVLGFILLGLGQGLRFGITAWGVQSRTIAARDDLAAAERLLRGLIERMDPGDADDPPLLRGLPGAMQFRSILPASAGGSRLRMVEAALGVDGTHRLVLRLTRNPRAVRLGTSGEAIEEPLLQGIDRMEIAYWRPAQDDAPAGWQRNWAARSLPGLIRIRLVFPADDGRHWPDIVAAPMRQRLAH
jgi:general secretion pathway protein J